ncbi:MAG TPA: hypothetical protein VLU91_04055 [Nitrososphaerales archaeon]|nr:hypothetical protein [Nitrososphaerales archaeon]
MSRRIRAFSLRVDSGTPVAAERAASLGVIGLLLGSERCSRISLWFWLSAFARMRAIPALPSSDIGGTLPLQREFAGGVFEPFGQEDLSEPPEVGPDGALRLVLHP